MSRLMVIDEHWSTLFLTMSEQKICRKKNIRLMVESILSRLRTGCPWRDALDYFGGWNTVYMRFNDCSSKGKLMENILCCKYFRSITTRYDKLKRSFQGMLALACRFLWLPMVSVNRR